jgi:hypothetical protein
MEGAWTTRSGDMSRRPTQAKPDGADLASHILLQNLLQNLQPNLASGSDRSRVFQSDGLHGLEHLSINQNNDSPVTAAPNG